MPSKRQWLTGFVFIAFLFGLGSRYLRVRSLECQILNHDQLSRCPRSLEQSLQHHLLHQSLLFDDFRAQLTTDETIFGHWILVDLKKRWPSQLRLTFSPDTLVYQLKLNNQLFTVSASGVANPTTARLNNLVLIQSSATLPNQAVPVTTHRQLVELITAINQVDALEPKEASLDKATLLTLRFSQPKTEVILDLNQPGTAQTLVLLLNSEPFHKLAQTGRLVVLDLRFKLPVLRLK